MAHRILVISHDEQLVELVKAPLQEEGYVLGAANDGPEGLRTARREQPDLVMVSLTLTKKMSGNQVCRRLRRDPATSHIRIILIAQESELDELELGPGSSVDDFLIRPFSAAELVTKVKPLLAFQKVEKVKPITTGNYELDQKMGGGVPAGSLTLIEGDSGAGKSVLSQQMMHGSLAVGYHLSIFTSENTVRSLIRQMQSLNMEVTDHVLLGRLRIYPIEAARLGTKAPPTLMKAMQSERGRALIVVDSLTSSIPQSSDTEVLSFFEGCKRLCGGGTTVLIVVHSHGVSRDLLIRIRSLCDAHLQLRTEEVGTRLLKTLEVTKVKGAEQTTGNIVSFEVEPGWGMRVVPISKISG